MSVILMSLFSLSFSIYPIPSIIYQTLWRCDRKSLSLQHSGPFCIVHTNIHICNYKVGFLPPTLSLRHEKSEYFFLNTAPNIISSNTSSYLLFFLSCFKIIIIILISIFVFFKSRHNVQSFSPPQHHQQWSEQNDKKNVTPLAQ